MNFDPKDVRDACREFASQVTPIRGLDSARLLWAICMNESSGGINCTPRYEAAFDTGGFLGDSAEMKPLLEKFGRAAACSYGPMQLMFCNAPPNAAPDDFNDLHTAMQYSVAFLNKLIRVWKPVTLTTIGQCWNSGSPRQNPSPGVQAYCQRLGKFYDEGIPA